MMRAVTVDPADAGLYLTQIHNIRTVYAAVAGRVSVLQDKLR
jgi:hypothetical protein